MMKWYLAMTELTPKKIYSCIQEDASLQNLPKLQTTCSMGLVWCKWNIPYQQHVRESAFLSFSSLMRCSKNWNSLPSLARNHMHQATPLLAACCAKVDPRIFESVPVSWAQSRSTSWIPGINVDSLGEVQGSACARLSQVRFCVQTKVSTHRWV